MHGLLPSLSQRLLTALCFTGAVVILTGARATPQSPPSLSSAHSQTANTRNDGSHGMASSKSLDLKFAESESLMEKGQLAEAEAAIREDLKLNPDSGSAHFLLGYILY